MRKLILTAMLIIMLAGLLVISQLTAFAETDVEVGEGEDVIVDFVMEPVPTDPEPTEPTPSEPVPTVPTEPAKPKPRPTEPTPTEPATEPTTEAPTEPIPTEAPTEAPTEPATEAPTEAPTEPSTIAPPVTIVVTENNKQPSVTEEEKEELTGTVDGYLRDTKGNPLAGIRIEMHSDPVYTFTDKDGYFVFENVKLGEHTLYIADPRISEKLIEIKKISIREVGKEGEAIQEEVLEDFGINMEDGFKELLKAANVELSEQKTEATYVIEIDPIVRGTILIRYIYEDEVIKEDRLEGLLPGKHRVVAEDIEGYILVTEKEIEVELSEQDIEVEAVVIVEYVYEEAPAVVPAPSDPGFPWIIATLILTPAILFFGFMITKKEKVDVTVETADGVLRFKANFNKKMMTVDLSKFYDNLNAGDIITVEFGKKLTAKLEGETIVYKNKEAIIHADVPTPSEDDLSFGYLEQTFVKG